MSEQTPEIPKEYIISFELNSFIWLPPKCASTTLSWIFRYFDFDKYSFSVDKFIPINNPTIHLGHSTNFPPNHENFIFICSIRNPYDRIMSYLKSAYGRTKNLQSVEFFRPTLNRNINEIDTPFNNHLKLFQNRKPDFIIRTENIFEDISKIPFVYNSPIYNCGVIEKMCKKKINNSPEFDFGNFFSKEEILKINEINHLIFELGNYEKL